MHATRFTLVMAAALAGCASSNSGVVAGFDGTLTISQRGVGQTSPQALTAAAVQQATAHCTALNRRYRQVDVKESPAGFLAPQAESELRFACD